MNNILLFSSASLFFGSSLFMYGSSIIYRKYCIFCGKTPPCTYPCNATRLEGKFLRFIIRKYYY